MALYQFKLSAMALAIGLALSACGGGSSDGGGVAAGNSSGDSGTTAHGVVTGFGSVYVNGVKYEVEGNTAISVDGEAATESALQVGMLVTVQGTVNADGRTGSATSIKYADQLEGVVTANQLAADGSGSLDVMGQDVRLTAETVFESKVAAVTSPQQIQAGNVVEVSGYASRGGAIVATRIEVKAAAQTPGREIEVKGVITNLTATSFTLGGLSIDYSGVSNANLPGVALANGQYVEVKSTAVYTGVGALIATKIELEDSGVLGHDGEAGEDLEVKGLVTAGYANGRFELNGRTVLVAATTRFEHGGTAQLQSGAKVKLEAHFNADGELVADEIEFAPTTNLELEGTLEAVDVTNGTVTVMGRLVHVNSSTLMLDESAAERRRFSLNDLSVADSTRLELKIHVAANGEMVAVKLKRTEFSNEAKIKGAVTATDGLAVAGVAVDTSNAGSIPTLSNGTLVEVEGSYSGGVLFASKVELETEVD